MAATTSKSAVVVAIELVLLVAVAWVTYALTNGHWRDKWLERDASDLSAMLANAKQNAAIEHDWQLRFSQADADYQKRLKETKDNADRTVSLYRAGQLRLRESLNCTARNLSSAATAAAVSDAARKCGLQPGDVEFLIRYAERADGIAEQLTTAQNLLAIIYGRKPK